MFVPLLNDFVNSKYCGKWRWLGVLATGSRLEGNRGDKCQHDSHIKAFIHPHVKNDVIATAMYGHSAGSNHECSLNPELL